jgi:hypothetical protein
MSIDVDHVIKHLQVGHKLIYLHHDIADILSIAQPTIVIRDIHGKKWVLNQDHLNTVKYEIFLDDLAAIVAKNCPGDAPEGSARRVLLQMNAGDSLEDSAGYLATLIDISPDSGKGSVLTFRDINEQRSQIYPRLLPNQFSYDAFLEQFRNGVTQAQECADEPILLRYFKNEFLPKMLSQLTYDNERWGDSWLMIPAEGQEAYVQEHIEKYFEYFNQFGKKVPWLKMASYAIIAQAREDHPEWML